MAPDSNQGIAVALARLEERQEGLKFTVDELRVELAKVKSEIDEIHDMAARWRGGVIVVLAFGGVIGWMMAMGDKLAHVLGWKP